jgi:hypothetical protein
MEYYQGSLRQFAEELLANGRGNGQILVVAQLDDIVVKDMSYTLLSYFWRPELNRQSSHLVRREATRCGHRPVF